MRRSLFSMLRKTFVLELYFLVVTHIRFLSTKVLDKIGIRIINPNIIVSLTSYPPRFRFLYRSLLTILSQSISPKAIVLTVFRDDLHLLPKEVCRLASQGLIDLLVCNKDIKSYKKLLPTLQKYPNAIIVTADDDYYYPNYWLKGLLHNFNPADRLILGWRGRMIIRDENNRAIQYRNWKEVKTKEYNSNDLVLTGIGGILYPPGCFHKGVFESSVYLQLAPGSDDLWFYFCAKSKGFTHKKIQGSLKGYSWAGSEKTALYESINRLSGNDKAYYKLLEYFKNLL